MFDQHFQVILADTERTKEIYYSLRYRVYCLERQFENPNAYPDKKECDRYDSGSAQFLVRSIESGEWLAGMRSTEDGSIARRVELRNADLQEDRCGFHMSYCARV